MSEKILYIGGTGEIVEKKSRFIASIEPVKTEEEARAFIASIKKKYSDARHNCSAYVCGDGGQITHCSDDGEPSGTAGRPMLDVLLNQNIKGICVVVTRYFGGVLLGTGGLVRAYQGAVIEGLNNCTVIEPAVGKKLEVITDYSLYGKIDFMLKEAGITVLGTDFGADVTVSAIIPDDMVDTITTKINDVTSGNSLIDYSDSVNFAFTNKGEVIFL